tara:strand:- start:679 stop:1026 length:348 start_codon:yes stop_codon:yes gene_type:complete
MKITKSTLKRIIKEELQKEFNKTRQPRLQMSKTRRGKQKQIDRIKSISSEMPTKKICKKAIEMAEHHYEGSKYGMYDTMHRRDLETLVLRPQEKGYPDITTKCFTDEHKKKYGIG